MNWAKVIAPCSAMMDRIRSLRGEGSASGVAIVVIQ
jgi:hypothetical protein